MKLKFDDKVYDALKWLCLIALPALSVLYSALAGVWGCRSRRRYRRRSTLWSRSSAR